MSQVNITLALAKHLNTFDVSTVLTSGVDYSGRFLMIPPGVNEEPEASDVFLTMNIIPTSSENSAFGDGATVLEQGLFRVSCYYPDGTGASDLIKLATAIGAHFWPSDHRGLLLVEGGDQIRVEKPPKLSRIYSPDDSMKGRISMDVDIRYYAHFIPS